MPPAQTTAQKIVRHTLRWATLILTLAVLAGSTLSIIHSVGKTLSSVRPLQSFDSTDYRYRAYIYLDKQSKHPAGVLVEHHWHSIYLGQFTALATDEPVDRLSLQWTEPNVLSIRCDQCTAENTQTAQTNWGKLHFSYDLGKDAP